MSRVHRTGLPGPLSRSRHADGRSAGAYQRVGIIRREVYCRFKVTTQSLELLSNRDHPMVAVGPEVPVCGNRFAVAADESQTCFIADNAFQIRRHVVEVEILTSTVTCLLYTSDAADERSSVDLG